MRKKILFWDNDIIAKITCFDLLRETEKVLNSNIKNFRILPSLEPQLRKNKRSWVKNYSESEIIKIHSVVEDLKAISVPENGIDELLSMIPNIDPGEAVLIASFLEEKNSILLTGDKRCLNALFGEKKDLKVKEVQDKLLGKVICFESLLLEISKSMPTFDDFKSKFSKREIKEKTLKIVLKSDYSATKKEFEEGVNSYLKDLLKGTNPNLLYKFPSKT